jgi:hypothetical protein
MYDNDPGRPTGPRFGDPTDRRVAPRTALGVLIALGIAALLFAFWPRGDTTQLTETTPAYRAPTTAPVTPTAPKPVTPQ